MTDAPDRIFIHAEDVFNPKTTWSTLRLTSAHIQYENLDTLIAKLEAAQPPKPADHALHERPEFRQGFDKALDLVRAMVEGG